ncbi:MAG: HAD family hydrolase [Chryseobacterium sp.]|nr:MAG: HAD family hydrolase [Chryseobacterium sp.]
MNKKYIVFDLDDTLYYEIDFLCSAFKSIAKNIAEDDFEDLYKTMLEIYNDKNDVFEFLSKAYNCDKQLLLKLYREHFPDIGLRNQVRETLELLKNNNVKMGLLTDGRSLTQRNKIKALKIESYFDKIIISEEFGSEKPNESNYAIFVEEGFDYYYIADNPKKDFISPNILGWKTIMIEDDENKKIHKLSNVLQEKWYAQKKTNWEYLYDLIN